MDVFSSRLRELRISAGFTQSEVAAKIGTTTRNYSAYENGREPPYEKLVHLAEFFEVTCDYLLGRIEFKTERDAFAYMEGLRILGVSEQLYAEMARLPSFESFLTVVYNYLCTDEKELQKINEAFFRAYAINADMSKCPPIRIIDKDLYYQGEIARFIKILDKEYKKYQRKVAKVVSSPDGSGRNAGIKVNRPSWPRQPEGY